MADYNVNGIKGVWLQNNDSQFIAPYTPERFIVDDNGERLDTKLKGLDLKTITSAQTEALDAIEKYTKQVQEDIKTVQYSDRTCLVDIYERLFPLNANLKIVANQSVTTCSVSYDVIGMDNTEVSPTTLSITRYDVVNKDGKPIINYDGNVAINSYGAIEDNLEYSVQEYKLEMTKDERDDISKEFFSAHTSVVVEVAKKYICMYGAMADESIDLASLDGEKFNSLTKVLADGLNSSPTIQTKDGDYIWIIVPKELNLNRVSYRGFDFSMNEPIEQTINDAYSVNDISLYNGTYKVYRSAKQLAANVWKLVLDGNVVVNSVENNL